MGLGFGAGVAKTKKALGATAAGFAAASELKEQAPKAEAVEELVEGSIGNDKGRVQ